MNFFELSATSVKEHKKYNHVCKKRNIAASACMKIPLFWLCVNGFARCIVAGSGGAGLVVVMWEHEDFGIGRRGFVGA
jgi:hypothetical protein